MLIGIDPKVDYAFKRLFGSQANLLLLINLLNAVLAFPPGRQIADLEIQNPFNEKEHWDDKLSIVDIKARDQDGRLFNVEMQMLATDYFLQRILYYWAKLFEQQLHEGDDFNLLRPTYSICFVNDILFSETANHHLIFRLTDGEHKLTFADELVIHLVELPKFQLTADLLSTPLDLWCYFLRHAEAIDREQVPKSLDVPPLRQALEVLTVLTQNDIEREKYEARLKKQRDERSNLRGAEERGILVGQIQAYEKMLRRAPSTFDQLKAMRMEKLKEMAADLEKQVLPGNGSPS